MILHFLFILVSLFTHIFSDSTLSHFQKIVTDDVKDVALKDIVRVFQLIHTQAFNQAIIPKDSLFEGTVESCASQCLFTKFFCRSFIVVSDNGKWLCIMEYKRNHGMNFYFTHVSEGNPSATLEGVYECIPTLVVKLIPSIKEEIDNVATITKDPTLLSEPRFDELLQEYGVSKSFDEEEWAELRAVLKTCAAALSLPKSTPTSFKNWLSGVESSQLMPPLTSQYTNNYKQLRRRPTIPDTPGVNVLAFLDLVSRVDQSTKTIYDPDERTLYIDSPDIQLLVIFYRNDDYIWAASGNKVRTADVELGVCGRGKFQDVQNNIIHDLVNAAARFECHVTSTPDLFVHEDDGNCDFELWRLMRFLTLYEPINFELDKETLLFQDLSQVVPKIHNKRTTPTPFTEQVRKSFLYRDVKVITQNT